MTGENLKITPSVTVHELLEAYPELEDLLIGMAPPFKKLRNPILRRSIAKVATIKHISTVGKIPLTDLIRRLREAVGQPLGSDTFVDEDYYHEKPDWFSIDKVVARIDEATSEGDQMTVVKILRKAKDMNPGELIELKTNFLPAPGIEVLRSKGYFFWVCKKNEEEFRTYFLKEKEDKTHRVAGGNAAR